MPLKTMFISEEEAKSRLESSRNLFNTSTFNIIEMSGSGRRKGDKALPEELRETIGVIAALVGPTVASKTFGCSVYEAHALANGKIKGENLPEKISDQLKPIRDAALDKTLKALNLIDDEKLDNTKAEGLSRIAQNLSRVASNITPELQSNVNAIQFNIFAPKQRDEDDYDVIEVTN